MDDSGRVSRARIALGGVGPAPVRARAAEQVLIGEPATDALFRAGAAVVSDGLEPESDIHASADYRRHLAGVLVRRALSTAHSRARRNADA
jgi:CO/xanthine dehydrogenase FAD-binding subunit